MAKKKKSQPPPLLSPKKYILTRVRTLPVHKCLINSNWESARLASIVVMRKHSNNNITAGIYLVDLLGRGVKNSHYRFNVPEEPFLELIRDSMPADGVCIEIPYALAHNIIYGAVAFAEDQNIEPYHEFAITSYILEEDTEDIELIDIEFGMEGKPVFIHGASPDED